MSASCVTCGRLCDGCMACYDDPYYGRMYEPEDEFEYEEEYIDEQSCC